VGALSRSLRLGAWVYLACLAYVIVRYVVLGTVPPSDIPLYLSNKALAAAGTGLAAWSLAMGPLSRMGFSFARAHMPRRKWIGMLGGCLVLVHIVLSVSLFGPDRYPRFYSAGGGLSAAGWLSLLSGVTAALLLIPLIVTSIDGVRRKLGRERWKRLHSRGPWLLALTFGHLAFTASPGWLTPAKWGVTLPVTLVMAATVLLALGTRSVERLRSRQRRLAPRNAAELLPDSSSSAADG
jgi:DMSO/TMAO reductase YedYZ heme-binding membrane subunit